MSAKKPKGKPKKGAKRGGGRDSASPGGGRKGGGGRGPGRSGRMFTGRHVAEIGRRGRIPVASPIFERGPAIPLEKGKKRPTDGLALVEFEPGQARVLRELGSEQCARDVVDALIWERYGWRGFHKSIESDARKAAARLAADPGARVDLTDLTTFTVDPETARDFDDAVSAREEGDSVRIWVHIADVAAHIAPGSRLDLEALRRATSVYVPGTVEPMLPEALSSDACSLSPGTITPAVTTEMVIAPDGRVQSVSHYRTLVRSDARLDYDQLDEIFTGKARAPEAIAEPLALTRKVADALAGRRPPSTLQIDSPEPEFEFDGSGHVISSKHVTSTESHRLIEHLMVVTNEQVAGLLDRSGTPGVYRVHGRPDTERAKELVERLIDLGVPTPPVPDPLQPEEAADLLGEISRMVAATVEREGRGQRAFTSLLLRTLQQAQYSSINSGHAGLGSEAYCHFTSPIRRYPDLAVHRGLLAQVGEGGEPHDPGTLPELATHCSDREREAVQAERDADDICSAFLLERELYEYGYDEVFQGEVAGLVGGGAFIGFGGELGDSYEGFLPASWLGDDWFELNEQATALVGERTGVRLRMGDPVTVTAGRVEPIRGRVTLGLPQRPG